MYGPEVLHLRWRRKRRFHSVCLFFNRHVRQVVADAGYEGGRGRCGQGNRAVCGRQALLYEYLNI